MEYRKLISFGKSSFVVSLPKAWVIKQKLKKGDVIYFDEKDNNLLLRPKETSVSEEKKEKTINIDGKNIYQIRREINAAYVENFKIIKLLGKELKEKTPEIKKLIKDLVALEILELDSEKIIAKDFLDMENTSILELIKKIDIITRSMLEDSTHTFVSDNYEDINLRDSDVNRLHLLIFRAARYGLRNPLKAFKNFNLDPVDLLNAYWIAFHIEAVADETKRIARYMRRVELKKPQQKIFEKLFIDGKTLYLDSIKAYYNQEIQRALELSNKKKEYILQIDTFYKNNNKVRDISYLADRYKRMLSHIHEIGRMVYQH